MNATRCFHTCPNSRERYDHPVTVAHDCIFLKSRKCGFCPGCEAEEAALAKQAAQKDQFVLFAEEAR